MIKILFSLLFLSYSIISADITVLGEASVFEKFDMVEQRFSITVRDKDSVKVMEKLTKKNNQLIAGLKKLGGKSFFIKSFNFNINEENKWEKGIKKKLGEIGVATISVKSKNVLKISKAISQSIKFGATGVNGMRYSFSDAKKNSMYQKALSNAFKFGYEKAKILASASGEKLGKLKTITESGAISDLSSPIIMKTQMLTSSRKSASIEVGEGEIKARVQLKYSSR